MSKPKKGSAEEKALARANANATAPAATPTPRTPTKVEPGVLITLKPEQVIGDDNLRFAVLESNIQALMADIATVGEVMVPVEVEPLESPVNGAGYRMTDGHARLEAVIRLNKEGYGLTLPAHVKSAGDRLSRLKRQVSLNKDRENLTPMDEALAIKKLLDAGVSKMDVRTIFSRPGSAKGGVPEPASNSFVNMRLSFLELPKKHQNMIHTGELPVRSAYLITTEPKDSWDSILEKAKKEVEADTKWEQREEANYLKTTQKSEKAEAAVTETKTALQTAEGKLKAAMALKDETAAKVTASFKTLQELPPDAPKDTRKETDKAFRDDQIAAKAAKDEYNKSFNEVQALKSKSAKISDKAERIKKALGEARAKKEGKAPVTPKAVTQAIAKEKGTGPVALTATEIRKGISDLDIAAVTPKVRDIAQILLAWMKGEAYNGAGGDTKLYRALQGVVGELPKEVTK